MSFAIKAPCHYTVLSFVISIGFKTPEDITWRDVPEGKVLIALTGVGTGSVSAVVLDDEADFVEATEAGAIFYIATVGNACWGSPEFNMSKQAGALAA
jgi:hypothetical protein